MPAVIFSGTKVKTLKNSIAIGEGAEVQSNTSVNPMDTATDAPAGSILINDDGRIFKKLDSGSSTNWEELVNKDANNIYWNDIQSMDASRPSVYQDSAGTAPTNGAGVSGGTHSISLDSSSPIAGRSMYSFNKTGTANSQGYGMRFDNQQDIDPSHAANRMPVVVSFNYKTDANYVDDYYRVYVYKIGSNQLEQLSSYDLFGNYSNSIVDDQNGTGVFRSVFHLDPSDTGFRILIHVAGNNAINTVLKVANFQANVESPSLNSPLNTPWQEYTPTWSRGSLTVTNDKAWYRIIGDSIQVRFSFQVTGGSGAASGMTMSIPSGYTFDTTNKLLNDTLGNSVGYWWWYDNSGSATQEDDSFGSTCISGSTNLNFRTPFDSNVLFSNALGTSDRLCGFAEFPVTELSNFRSNILASQWINFMTQIGGSINRGSPNSTIDGTSRDLTWGSDSDVDDDNQNVDFDRSTGKFTAKATGYYLFHGVIEVLNVASAGWIRCFARNATQVTEGSYNATRNDSGATSAKYLTFISGIFANKGDEMYLRTQTDGSGTQSWGNGLTGSSVRIAFIPDLTVVGNAGGPGYSFYKEKIYTTSDTWTKPAGLKAVEVEVQGAGGGGAGAVATGVGEYSCGTGGLAGGYSKKIILEADLNSSESVTIGAGGAGGTGGNGSSGGNSSFGSHATGNGGSGGVASSASSGLRVIGPNSGGTGSGGDLNIQGGRNETAFSGSFAAFALSTKGSDSKIGFGGTGQITTTGSGAGGGGGYGAGGGGSANGNSGHSAQTGGAGGGGIIIVREYF